VVRKQGLGGSFWPSSQQELLLRAALCDKRTATEAWRTVRPTVDIDKLEDGSYAVLPLLYRHLTELGIQDRLLPRLKGVYRHTWSRNQVVFDRLASVLRALADSGVDTVVAKSAAVALRYYPDLGLRPVSELDIGVLPHRASRAFRALEDAGWRRSANADGRLLDSGHSARFRDATGLTCFLRTHLLPQPAGLGNSTAEWPGYWATSVEAAVRGIPTRVLRPTDQLLHTWITGARGTRFRTIQWIIDSVMILRVAGSNIDWGMLFSQARETNAVMPVRDSVAYLRRAFRVPIPEPCEREVRQMPVSPRDALSYRIAGFGGRILGEFPATMGQYVRWSANDRPVRAILQLPRFLQQAWQLDHLWQVPVFAAKTVSHRLTHASADRHAVASVHPKRHPNNDTTLQ
jgi:hypothetical protein